MRFTKHKQIKVNDYLAEKLMKKLIGHWIVTYEKNNFTLITI